MLALPDGSGTDYIEDHRGKTVYSKLTGESREVTELGPLPDTDTELKPGEDDIWIDSGWQLDPEAIHRHRAAKHTEINQWRDQQEHATVEHLGAQWDADPISRRRIEAVLLADTMPLGYWTDADNLDQPMTLAQLRELYAVIVHQGGLIHARQRQMKAEVDALADIEAVKAYPVGW
ncbi:hypothetical protein AN401_11790 [Zobellella denitrificans]|uniref:DUF4376 domain-containing protein n=1 Tax=Zobellella denitrificans TaxID=347534 RepID=A0A291HUK7_9GAMM|nr:hypothetical protein AN401_10970 [Zobellella denitrificans]ATG75916.1 hypothetical protein AN401_11790 [Zobellella denitrificans]